jgi:hypothetical protein
MTENKKISDWQKEKLFNRCIKLINQGFSISYCRIKFAKHGSFIDEYLSVAEKIKNNYQIQLDDSYIKKSFNKIYKEFYGCDEQIKGVKGIEKGRRLNNFLRSSIIFASVIIFLSFSFAGLIYASQGSLPGSNLYIVKRFMEDMKKEIAPESRESLLHYQFLNNRIDEAESFLELKNYEKTNMDELLDEVEEEFKNCETYNYFGESTKEEVRSLIEKVKEEYAQGLNLEEVEKEPENAQENNDPEIFEDETGENSGTGEEAEDDENQDIDGESADEDEQNSDSQLCTDDEDEVEDDSGNENNAETADNSETEDDVEDSIDD